MVNAKCPARFKSYFPSTAPLFAARDDCCAIEPLLFVCWFVVFVGLFFVRTTVAAPARGEAAADAARTTAAPDPLVESP